MEKYCTGCGKNKKLIEFYKTGKYYRSECKCCSIKLSKNYYCKKNKQIKQRFCVDCGEKITNYKRCDNCNKIERTNYTANYYIKNKNKISEYKKKWYQNKIKEETQAESNKYNNLRN